MLGLIDQPISIEESRLRRLVVTPAVPDPSPTPQVGTRVPTSLCLRRGDPRVPRFDWHVWSAHLGEVLLALYASDGLADDQRRAYVEHRMQDRWCSRCDRCSRCAGRRRGPARTGAAGRLGGRSTRAPGSGRTRGCGRCWSRRPQATRGWCGHTRICAGWRASARTPATASGCARRCARGRTIRHSRRWHRRCGCCSWTDVRQVSRLRRCLPWPARLRVVNGLLLSCGAFGPRFRGRSRDHGSDRPGDQHNHTSHDHCDDAPENIWP